MKKIFLQTVFLLISIIGFSQTNPTVQNLPFTVDFGTAGFTPPFTNTAAWTGDGTRPYSTQAAAENSLSGTDVPAGSLINATPTGTTPAAGQYGDSHSGNARLAIVTSGNATFGTTQFAVAVNTTGASSANITYDLGLAVANPRTIGVVLQYRIGTSGSFTTIAGSAVTYTAGSTNGGDADGTNDYDSYSFPLPAAALNQAVVQIRWATWRGGAGNSSGIFIDNVIIGNPLTPCTEPAAQPSALTFPSTTANSINGSFTATTADAYLVIRNATGVQPADPIDGTTYTAGTAYGSSIAVSSAASATFTDNGLSPNTTYYYFVYAYNNAGCTGGPNYNTTVTPLQGNATTASLAGCTAPATPTVLNLTPANNAVSGNFTGTGASSYMVIVSTASSLGTNVLNGTTYPVGTAIPGANGGAYVASISSNTFFNIGALSVSTQYYFYVYAMNTGCGGEPFYSATSLNGNTTTTNTGSGIPAGYYNGLTGLSCGNLKDALSSIITSGQVTLSYGDLDDTQMPVADVIQSDDGLRTIIWDIYTNNTTGPEPFEYNSSQNPVGGFCGGGGLSNCWNKEHTFPKSWFNSQLPTYADLFVVRPTDINVNSKRGNIPYSIVGGATTYTFPASTGTYPGVPILDKVGASTAAGITLSSAFEPADGVKGDIARAYFYILTRYQGNLNSWASLYAGSGIEAVVDGTTGGGTYPSFKLPYLTMLYNWHVADPVDAREINFNNLVYSQQNNRNPYIDHPEYVAKVFSCTGVVPVTIIDFTAQKIKSSVLLQWYATMETSFRRYDVERSVDGVHFNKIGEVAGQNLANYSFMDNDLPKSGVIYYRLRMIDLDGKSRIGKIATVKQDNFSTASIYPNPVKESVNMRLDAGLATAGNLIITDISGRIVKQQTVNANEFNLKIDVSRLSAGKYFLKIISSKEVINQSFMIAQ